jgi:hypothetical protein
MKTKISNCFLLVTALALNSIAALDINSATTNWNIISYTGHYPDYFNDQQTGQYDSDIVGTNNAAAFYSKFDDAGTSSLTDGTLAFRVRMSGSSKTYWENTLFIGMDANLDGAIDLFAGLYKNNTVNLYYPGNGLNISPNTTTISSPFYSTAAVSGNNYSFVVVDSSIAFGEPTDTDSNSHTDYFVSFSIDFSLIISALTSTNIIIDQNTPMMFLAATATQQNSLNQDLNGAPKITQANGSSTWQQLGAASIPTSSTGLAVPEPNVVGMLAIGALAIRFARRKSDPTLAGEDPFSRKNV